MPVIMKEKGYRVYRREMKGSIGESVETSKARVR